MAKDLRRLISRIQELPTLPQVAVAIFNLIQDPLSSARDVERVMSRDPALAAKVLRLVNSAYFGFPHKISDLGHAIVILGFSTVKSIALSMTIIDLFPGEAGQKTAFDKERFWRHSVAAAHCARAGALRLHKGAPEVAFVTGLLHDIGMLVLDQYAPDAMAQALARAEERQCTFHAAERELGGMTHAEVGGLLVENWRLADEVVNAVRYHEEPDEAADSIYAALVAVADRLAMEADLGASGESVAPAIDERHRAILGLDEPHLAALASQLEADRGSIDLFILAAR